MIVLLTVFALYRELLAISYNETFATVRGVPVNVISLFLITQIALIVVMMMMMRIVGLILGIALLKRPAAIAGLIARDIRQMMVLASGLGMVFTISGLWLSYLYTLTSGAAIILLAVTDYLLGLLDKKGLQWVHWSGEPV